MRKTAADQFESGNSPINKNSLKSLRIWKYSPVQSTKTAANHCESGNIHQSVMRKTAADQCESGNSPINAGIL
jgi:hypothetical protein